MKVDGLTGISQMGDVLVREAPATFMQETTAAGEVLAPVQMTPAVQYVYKDREPFPWLLVAAGGGLLLFLLTREKGG